MQKRVNLSEILENIKIYADGADFKSAREMIEKYNVKGFTTNPSLMRKAGIANYESFAREFVSIVKPLPVSLEVFADDIKEMERQARIISDLGENIYVKIPVINTEKISMCPLIKKLTEDGIKINTTAVFTKNQIDSLYDCLDSSTNIIISIFAGRIADAGYNPEENIGYAVQKFKDKQNIEILWASTREAYNLIQARNAGAHIITVQNSIITKLNCMGKDLEEFSRDTVFQFRNDALESRYII